MRQYKVNIRAVVIHGAPKCEYVKSCKRTGSFYALTSSSVVGIVCGAVKCENASICENTAKMGRNVNAKCDN